MGKKRRKNTKGTGWNDGPSKGVRQNYPEIIKENKNFEQYYKLQNICPESEWDDMMEILRQPLPTAFRITSSTSQTKALQYIIEEKLVKEVIASANEENETAHVRVFPLNWYKDKLAWQMNLTRSDIRKNKAFFNLHNFLIHETESGNMSRQEAVSMIPPLTLDVQPHHKVLDMCAAPGSKTAQLIESLHSAGDSSLPSGFVIANDVDNRRCYMLVHQAKRLQSPSLVITNHDAGHFPNSFLSNEDGTNKILKFDRVLCDVPCSGDGTFRKNIDVWKKWSPANALFLHQAQFQILKRGCELLEVGGRVVYSTCSLNPIEDEAVVHRMLKQSDGALRLLKIDLEDLKSTPGLYDWIPCSKDLVSFKTHADVTPQWEKHIRDYVFPPDLETAKKFELEKCMRVLPHQQDTGGFFIALFEKVKLLPWENNQAEAPYSYAPVLKKMKRTYKEDPFFFLKEDDEMWKPLVEFYGLDPSLNLRNFMCRKEDGTGRRKNVYMSTEIVRNFVQTNEARMKIINTGIKTFARAEKKWSDSEFRLAQEGLTCLRPFINKRVIKVTKTDLVQLLNADEGDPPILIACMSKETQKEVEDFGRGTLVLTLESTVDEDGPPFTLHLIGWRGINSMRAYVARNERVHYLRLCSADTSKYDKPKEREGEKVDEQVMEIEADIEESKDKSESGNGENIVEDASIEDPLNC